MNDPRSVPARVRHTRCRPTAAAGRDHGQRGDFAESSAAGGAARAEPRSSLAAATSPATRRFAQLLAVLGSTWVPPTELGDPVQARPLPPYAYAAAARRSLPQATGDSCLIRAPLDEGPCGGNQATIACLVDPLPVYDEPAGVPFAIMAGRPAYLPVIDRRPGWVRVLLPARPNGSTGWLDTERLTLIPAHHDVRIQLEERSLYVGFCGRIRRWPVSVRGRGPVIPACRTYALPSSERRTAGLLLAAHHPGGAGNIRVGNDRRGDALITSDSAMQALAQVRPAPWWSSAAERITFRRPECIGQVSSAGRSSTSLRARAPLGAPGGHNDAGQ
jgi:hypothetical protein